jgi:hypothetical protein
MPNAEECDQLRYHKDFVEHEHLGRGAFGVVVAAINRVDGRKYAVKKIRMDTSGSWNVLREVSTLSGLQHAHIVRYFQAWRELSNPAAEGFNASSETGNFTTRERQTVTSFSSAGKGLSSPGRALEGGAAPSRRAAVEPLPPVAEAELGEWESATITPNHQSMRTDAEPSSPEDVASSSGHREQAPDADVTCTDSLSGPDGPQAPQRKGSCSGASPRESDSGLSTSEHSTGSASGAESSALSAWEWDWDRSRAVIGSNARHTQLWSEASTLSSASILASQAPRSSLAVAADQVCLLDTRFLDHLAS